MSAADLRNAQSPTHNAHQPGAAPGRNGARRPGAQTPSAAPPQQTHHAPAVNGPKDDRPAAAPAPVPRKIMRVLICDRLPVVRRGLSALLEGEADIHIIESTGSGIEAMVLTRRHRPHVVITGLSLDGMSGVDLVRRLNEEHLDPKPRIVVFSSAENHDLINRLLHEDVSGLLVEEVTREQLGTAVRAAADGQTMLAPQVATHLVSWFRQQQSSQAEAPPQS